MGCTMGAWRSLLIAVLVFTFAATTRTGCTNNPLTSSNVTGTPASATGEVSFSDDGHTEYGDWHTDVTISPALWRPGTPLKIDVVLKLSDDLLTGLTVAGIKADQIAMLVTAERSFDADGWLRLPSDERMSTLLTPTGLAIEGGVQAAVTTRYGYGFRTPVDEFISKPVTATEQASPGQLIRFSVAPKLPEDLPPGIYRVRLDFGAMIGKRVVSLNGEGFTQRPREKSVDSYIFSPPLRANGTHVSGRTVDAGNIQPRIPWVILAAYNSNGYRGVVADEDKPRFALSERSIIPDEVILPLYDDTGKNIAYSLEPQFPADNIDGRNNIPWDYTKGELSVKVTGPDGQTKDLGKAPFVEKRGLWPTTKKAEFAAWRPTVYGRYTVTATGWLADVWGNRYEGGGTYHFWIAKRMTLATSTFQGMAYPVGSRYGRDIGFSPAVPADVEVNVQLYVNSNPNNARTLSYSGRATPAGLFGTAQGMKSFPLDAPGEYHAQILAKYTDPGGHLWVESMRHAGIVYPEDSPLIAHGKKLLIKNELLDRGETGFEGFVEPGDNFRNLAHLNFPYQSGDVLLIASEQQGANKIEPVLTYEIKGQSSTYDRRFQGVGLSNTLIKTANGYSPHLFPEFITDLEYYYCAAPRPGFMSRFLVGENGVRAPYWPTSPNNFGGQIGASNNGDLPGDIYRLIGGVVVNRKEQETLYGGYMASAFILPKDTKNNRVIAPGSEELIGSDGEKARLFLVGTRPGMAYEVGATFAPAVQIDPILPANIRFVLNYPDGRQKVAEGTGDRFGTFVGTEKWPLDVGGVYKFTLVADWESYKGHMPGLPATGGEFYVYDRERPVGAIGLKVNLPDQSRFSPAGGLLISGASSGGPISYAIITPGAVIEQGVLSVVEGKFEYKFDPEAIHKKAPIYDILNLANGKPDIGRVIHITFFSREKGPDGKPFYDFSRVILRGTQVISTR